jgi:hypothetical protein
MTDPQDLLVIIVIVLVLGISYYTYKDKLEAFQLKCIVSTVDGNKYCVREREKLNEAVDLLAEVTNTCEKLVAYMNEHHPNKDCVQRLVKKFNPRKIRETLPTSSYTAYSENKGEKIAFCLNRKKEDNNKLIDKDTLCFVAIHEMAHIMTKSIGHKTEFWQNFKFLLENAKKAGLHNPRDYKKEPREYCGMTIHDNPYYDA